MSLSIVNVFSIILINLICFTISSSAYTPNEKDSGKITMVLDNLKYQIDRLELVMEHVNQTTNDTLKSLLEPSKDDNIEKILPQLMATATTIENDYLTYRYTLKTDEAVERWIRMVILRDNTYEKIMKVLEEVEPMILEKLTSKFQDNLTNLNWKVEYLNMKPTCDQYHAMRDTIQWILLNMMLIEMKAMFNSIFHCLTVLPVMDEAYDNEIDSLTYGRQEHLDRVISYADKAIRLGKDVKGHFGHCEHTLLPSKNSRLFGELHMIYAENWLGIGNEKALLKLIRKEIQLDGENDGYLRHNEHKREHNAHKISHPGIDYDD